MVKAKITGLALAGVLALSGACVGIFARRAKTEADAASVSLTTSNAELVLPAGDSQAGYTAYEQYLSLTAPTDVALCEKYVAVADSDALYIYERAKGSYFKTEIPEKGTDGTITKIGFSSDRLFVAVSASSNYFYEYNFSDKSFQKLNDINCSTFCISENTLYTASIGVTNTTIASYSIADLATNPTPKNLGTLDKKTTPSMTKLGSRLYCTIDDRAYHIDLSTNETFGDKTTSSYLSSGTSDTENVRSTCAHNGAFYYTADGGLYRAELSTTDDNAKKATCVLEGENFGALTSFGDSMYCIREKSVLRFDAEETNYKIADYEISSSSDSVGRLSGATDVVRAGSLVVVADTENHRVTVYDSAAGTYSVIGENDDFSPTLVATDGETIAAASDDKVYVCKYGEKQFSDTAVSNKGNIVGIACVYGSVYYVTQNDIQGRIGGGEPVTKSNGTPTALTSDLYGDLFVAYQDGNVKRFTEEEFLESGETGTTLDGVTVPSSAKAMRADFKGNLYYLDESGALCCNGGKEPLATKIDATNFVYTDDTDKSPVSFALGYEDDEVYFLFGDFIVKTKAGALGFPTLDRIATQDVGEELGRTHTPEELARVNVSAGEVGIHVNLSYMKSDTPYFPYAGYSLFTRESEGVLLAETDDFRLVALYEDAAYRVYLLRKAGDPAEEEWTEGEGSMYLTSDVYVYYYPCVLLDHYPCEDESGAHGHEPVSAPVPAHSDAKLKRGTSVTVLGYTRSPDGEYALISYENGNAREAATGYVPRSFLTDVVPYPDDEDEYWVGTLKPDAGVVFVADDGSATIVPEAGAQVRLYDNGDGTYTARYTDADGLSYSATVTSSMIDRGESDAWRIALIVILCVVAVGIVGAYVYLLPRSRKKIS